MLNDPEFFWSGIVPKDSLSVLGTLLVVQLTAYEIDPSIYQVLFCLLGFLGKKSISILNLVHPPGSFTKDCIILTLVTSSARISTSIMISKHVNTH